MVVYTTANARPIARAEHGEARIPMCPFGTREQRLRIAKVSERGRARTHDRLRVRHHGPSGMLPYRDPRQMRLAASAVLRVIVCARG